MNAPLRVGMLGCGMIAGGPVREGRPIRGTHAEALRNVTGVELVAAADPDGDRLTSFGKHWGIERLYQKPAELLAHERPDIVIVATPPEFHEALCLEAVRSGVRGVLCEKPFSGNAAAAERIVRSSVEAGAALVVNFSRRWDSSHREAARRIANGELGDIRTVFGTYTGTLRGNGTHFLDTLGMMLGSVTFEVDWVGGALNGADGALDAVLLGAGGTRVHLAAVRDPEYFVFEIQILGSLGRIRFCAQGNEIFFDVPTPDPEFPGYRYLRPRVAAPSGSGSDGRSSNPLPRTLPESFANAITALARAVQSGTRAPVDPMEHVRTLQLADTIVSRAHLQEARS